MGYGEFDDIFKKHICFIIYVKLESYVFKSVDRCKVPLNLFNTLVPLFNSITYWKA